MIVRAFEQGSEAWHAWRLLGLTATDAPKLDGYWGSPREVWLAKQGKAAAEASNAAMQRGMALEPTARKLVEAELAVLLQPMCGEHAAWPIARASFDGVAVDFDGNLEGLIVEIKCPERPHWHKANEIPHYYLPQLLHQATVAEVECVVFASYHPDCTPKLRLHTVTFSAERRAAHLARCKDWWERYILGEEEPEDTRKVVERTDTRWGALATDFLIWNARAKEADRKLAAIRAALTEAAGDADRLEGGGVVFVRSQRAGGVDYGALVADVLGDGADLSRWRRPGTTYVRIVPEED